MRLITKTTLFYLLIALFVFGFGGYLTYYAIKQEISRETDFEMVSDYRMLRAAIESGKPIDALQNEKVSIVQLATLNPLDTNYTFSDTLAMHPYWKRLEPFRQLQVSKEINGAYYKISVVDNFLEVDDMMDGVISILSRLFITLGSILLLCSFLMSKWLFKPFQKTLEQIKNFNIKQDAPLQLTETSTKEFQQLNDFVGIMTNKANNDYQSLKEFSENAAHEIQTPLAIAKGKLELLIEHTSLPAEQLQLVADAQMSLTKLSRLGHSLTLLTKINNKEFANQTQLNFSKVVANNIHNFKEIASLKKIELSTAIQEQVELRIHPSLADVLVGNLLKNAIRHNTDEGWIKVDLTNQQLSIRNTGKPPAVPTQQLFERFRKSNQSSSSLGLGLAIVKKIGEVSGCKVLYDYKKGIHHLAIIFPN